MSDFARHYCSHCGDLCKGKYCNRCTTAAGRAEIDRQNVEIRVENEAKGFIYT